MLEYIITALEVMGVLLIAAGVVFALLPLIGLTSLAAGGAVLICAAVGAVQVPRLLAKRGSK